MLHALEQQHAQAGDHQHGEAVLRKQAARIPLHKLRDIIRGRKGNSAHLQSSGEAEAEAALMGPSKVLTGQILATRSWQQALTLFIEFSDVFNAVNTAALVTHISKLFRSSGSSGSRVKGVAANAPGGVDLLEALEELRDFSEGELPNYGPQGLANTTCAFANLGCLSRRYAQLVTARSEPSEFSNKELTQLLWSFATAGYCPDARWLRACYSELAVRRSSLNNRELCSALWALGKLNLDPGPGWMSIVLFELSSRSDTLIEPDLANILWALATLNHQPPRQILSNFLSASARLAPSMQPKSLCIILWSASVGGWPIPPPWVNAMCEGLGRHCLGTAGLPRILCSDAAMALHALGRLRFQPPVEVTSSLSSIVVANMGHDIRTDDLVSWCCGLAGLGYRPSARSLARFHHACIKRRRLLKCTPEQLTAMLCAQAKLGHDIHPTWVASLQWQLSRRFLDFKSRELANLLWALARTHHSLPSGTLSLILHALVQSAAASPTAAPPYPQTPPPPHTNATPVAAPQTASQAQAQQQSQQVSPQTSQHGWRTSADGRSRAAAWGHAAIESQRQQQQLLQQSVAGGGLLSIQQEVLRTQQTQHAQHRQHAQCVRQQQQPPPVAAHPMFGALKQLQELQQERFQLQQQQQQQQSEQEHRHSEQPQQQQQQSEQEHCHAKQLQQPLLLPLQQQEQQKHQQQIEPGEQGIEIPLYQQQPMQLPSAYEQQLQQQQPQLPKYPWRNPRPLQAIALPFSHAHPAARAEAAAPGAAPHSQAQQQQQQQALVANAAMAAFAPHKYASGSAKSRERGRERSLVSSSAESVSGNVGGGALGASRTSVKPAVGINSGDFGRGNSRGGPVGSGSLSSSRSYSPRHMANALWALPMVLPVGQRLEFGSTHRQLLRAAERAWIGPYFRAACVKQGTRGMLLGAQLVGRIRIPPHPRTATSSSNTATHPQHYPPTTAQAQHSFPDTTSRSQHPSPSHSFDSHSSHHAEHPTSTNTGRKSRTSTSSNTTTTTTNPSSSTTTSTHSKHNSSSSSSSSNNNNNPNSNSGSSSGSAPAPARADVVEARKHAHLVSRNAAYAIRRNVAAEELSRSMAVPACELVQTAQAFVALGHRPSPAWLHLHQWAAARQWPTIELRQRRRLVRCYRELCFHVQGSNIGLSATAVGEDGGGVSGAACELPAVRLAPPPVKLHTHLRGRVKVKGGVNRGRVFPSQKRGQQQQRW